MIEKLDLEKVDNPGEATLKAFSILNQLVDAVNELHAEAENNARIRANHENLIDTLVEENNIHEKQIDELQMKVEPEKCERRVDPYAEQRKWIGKLCKFWDFVYDHDYFDTLKGITDEGLFIGYNGSWEHCEPVKPDDDIIYKGGDNVSE